MTSHSNLVARVNALKAGAKELERDIARSSMAGMSDEDLIGRLKDRTASERHLKILSRRVIDPLRNSLVLNAIMIRRSREQDLPLGHAPAGAYLIGAHVISYPPTEQLPVDLAGGLKEPTALTYGNMPPNTHPWVYAMWCHRFLVWEAVDHDPDCADLRRVADLAFQPQDEIGPEEVPEWWGMAPSPQHRALLAPLIDETHDRLHMLLEPPAGALQLYQSRHPGKAEPR